MNQRTMALARANTVRYERARIKTQLRSGELTHDELLDLPPDCLDTATIYEVLLWMRGMGHVRAQAALYAVNIPEYARVGDLSVGQRDRLIGVLRHPGTRPFPGDAS